MDYRTMFFSPVGLALLCSHSDDVAGLFYDAAITFQQTEVPGRGGRVVSVGRTDELKFYIPII